MASSQSVPQSVTPSVAFEIPVDKKELNGSSPSTIQKRLAAQANSPRREINLEDINKKLSEASKRKDASVLNAKTASHNAKVEKAYEKSKEEETDKIKALEEHISSKLSNAENKRDNLMTSLVQKLSKTTMNKLKRGAKAKEDEKWSARELETKIDIKGLTAELRREELKLKTQEELAVSNQDKFRRGQLAIGVAEVEAKQIENRSDQKIIAANHRREMQHILASARIGESTAEKKEKVAGVRTQEEEESIKRLAEIDEKMKLVEERKAASLAGKVQRANVGSNDKMLRAADVRRQEEERAKEKNELNSTKVESANQRRDNIIREQQKLLQKSASKKEQLVVDKQKQEEKISIQSKLDIQSKLLSAHLRKEDLLASKVSAARSEQQKKKERAKNTWISSLNESKELKQTSDKRLQSAAKRKNKIMKKIVDGMQDVNKNKIDKVDKMNKNKELGEIHSLVEIENRLAAASASREIYLIAKSSSKKRALSPRSSPTGNHELEARIDAANLRREIYLTNKVGKPNKNSNSPKINKALFAAVSPKQSEGSPMEHVSPRIKAARLEEFQRSIQENEHRHRSFNMPLVAIGGIAVVLVGFLSFLKSK
mmetsp:Transcript_10088/g.22525  ORF Transcript_10088/g.22525 Transcript_10088/m.22525 type:complete len:601 (+) Transcript_10088:54-1856(+)|eukprot:CAMPEP_0172325572 /NCGR_PEP_ID=MMETSP1058-20130122/54393_1 /TAXON_ID=83371 /ORGANISM="Detonula confervacea, Strain CCMP 353" /LENGTH=600 /DNA_ID=CAMNT_0013042157 /DNA_START=41 /DNA_END=1843 /DNA_ORIENTATION=+